MKQPTITFEGRHHPVESVSWDEKGKVHCISFSDSNGNFHTAFDKNPWNKEGLSESGLLYIDLQNHLKGAD